MKVEIMKGKNKKSKEKNDNKTERKKLLNKIVKV